MKKISAKRVLVGLVAALVVILVVPVGYLIWGSWITPFEKPALRNALDQAENLEGCTSDNDSRYEGLVTNADAAMNLAEHRAISEYDHQLVLIAQMQLKGAKSICTLRRKAATDSRYATSLRTIESVQLDGYRMLHSHLQ